MARGSDIARFRLGIDVGGTFTDFFLSGPGGSIEICKEPSTPEDPSVGVLAGLGRIAQARGMPLRAFAGRIGAIVHGTTVTTNAVLTRGGARTGLVTTEGVRDALEMRRGIREEQYDNRFRNVVPLVPRRLRIGTRGRLDYQGREIAPVDLDGVRRAVEAFKREGVSAVAICFMNAFANPAHERAAAEVVRKGMPQAYLSVSSEVLPTIRFYNRVSTAVLNAYVGPVLSGYLGNLTSKLAAAGFGGVLLIMQSNGGVALPAVTARLAANTLLSGPAAGPRAGAAYVGPDGGGDCVVVDMGGTSFDASLVQGGSAALRTEGEIDRLRVALPSLDIHTIGAGGGSIGWVDAGGLLRVGPRSAGAAPGPACYGRGGELPTCTDANVVLGYLDPAYFAGGRMPLDAKAARAAIERHAARPLGLGVEAAASGIYRVINANMAHGVREITVKRGLDPRDFPLVVAGGAGPLHACMIAREMEMPFVVVPPTASTLCAMGMLLSDLQHDFSRSFVAPLDRVDFARLGAMVDGMAEEGFLQLAQEGVPEARAVRQVALDLRYLKQYHEVTVPVPAAILGRGDAAAIARAFHAWHNRLYGYDLAAEGTRLELITVRVRTSGRVAKPRLPRIPSGRKDPSAALKGRRRAFVPERGRFAEIPVYDGHRLRSGNRMAGPALIERTDTAILVTADYGAVIDRHGSCLIRRKEGTSHA